MKLRLSTDNSSVSVTLDDAECEALFLRLGLELLKARNAKKDSKQLSANKSTMSTASKTETISGAGSSYTDYDSTDGSDAGSGCADYDSTADGDAGGGLIPAPVAGSDTIDKKDSSNHTTTVKRFSAGVLAIKCKKCGKVNIIASRDVEDTCTCRGCNEAIDIEPSTLSDVKFVCPECGRSCIQLTNSEDSDLTTKCICHAHVYVEWSNKKRAYVLPGS